MVPSPIPGPERPGTDEPRSTDGPDPAASPPPATAESGAGGTWSELVATRLARIDTALDETFAAAVSRLAATDDDLTAVGDEIAAFVATGGKRLRPLLVVLGHELGADRRDPAGRHDDADAEIATVLPAAVAVELVHTWALVHDDIIDDDDTRRGEPTTHRRFTARHRRAGWAGDPDRYGVSMALLAGDLLAVLAEESFEQCPVATPVLAAARRDFTAMRLEVMAGQVLDVQVAAERTTDRDRALRVATLKSGRYSVTRPLQLGARLAGAPDDFLVRLGRIGDAVGVAFQLRDDLLGVLGDPRRTGKPVGNDLREGKRTVLVAEAANRLDPAALVRLESILGTPDVGSGAIGDCITDLVDCGAVAAVQARVDDLLASATVALGELPPSSAATALHALAAELGSRTH